jgi:glycosyltransferase involved in cell wall biosynthesis
MPLVSVVTPTTRRPKLLLRAIKSVLAQSLIDLELIIVIDGPNPETVEALTVVSDSRVRVIQNERSVGGGEATNIGAAAAGGQWVAFLDDDDEWLPRKTELQLIAAESSDQPIIVSCASYIITPHGRYVWPRRIYDNSSPIDEYLFDRRSLFKGEALLQTSSLFMPRFLFNSLKFPYEHYDWDLLLRAVKYKGVRIITLTEPLVNYYEDQRDSMTGSFPWRGSLDWLEKNRSLISRRAYSGFCLTVVGAQAAKTRDYSTFFSLLVRSFRKGSPRPIHIALYFIFWLLPLKRRHRVRNIFHRAPVVQ